MHDALGLCEGCARTLDEIARWSRLEDADKARILTVLSARQDILRRAGVQQPQPGKPA
jgi:hypothetical protein